MLDHLECCLLRRDSSYVWGNMIYHLVVHVGYAWTDERDCGGIGFQYFYSLLAVMARFRSDGYHQQGGGGSSARTFSGFTSCIMFINQNTVDC